MQLNDTARGRLRPHLQDDERLLWAGAPASAMFATRRQILAALQLAATAILALIALAVLHAVVSSTTFGLVALIVCASLLAGAGRLALWFGRRFGESYGVTDRRVVVLNRDGSIRSQVSLLKASDFRLEGAPGRASIRLGEDEAIWTISSGIRPRLAPDLDAPRLSALSDAPSIMNLIREAALDWERRWSGDEPEA